MNMDIFFVRKFDNFFHVCLILPMFLFAFFHFKTLFNGQCILHSYSNGYIKKQ